MTAVAGHNYRMLIDGQFVAGDAGSRSIINQSDGRPFAEVPEASPERARKAVTAAQKARGLK